MKKIAVVGLGKAGLPLAAVIADSGHEVVGIDLDSNRCDMINKGINPLPEEPGLAEIIKAHGGKTFCCTSSYEDHAPEIAAYIVIVPLFIDRVTHRPDFSILDRAFQSIRTVLKSNDTVILETTVPPETLETRFKPILDDSGVRFRLGYSPERIMTGYSISRYKEFPKVVAGIDRESLFEVTRIYSGFCRNVIPVSSVRAAELVKVCEGVYRDVNIALANEVEKISRKIGVDFWEIREAATHEFCHILQPGIVGGHCIPVYPYFFLDKYESSLVRTARNTNEKKIDETAEAVFRRLKAKDINPLTSRVALLGITYREGVVSDYLSPALLVAEQLRVQIPKLYGWDPLLEPQALASYGLVPIERPEAVDVAVAFHRGDAMTRFLSELHTLIPMEDIVDLKNCLGSLDSSRSARE